jgi:hypothetical protein
MVDIHIWVEGGYDDMIGGYSGMGGYGNMGGYGGGYGMIGGKAYGEFFL